MLSNNIELEKSLNEILTPYGNWFNDVGDKENEEARKALITFYHKLSQAEIKKENKEDIFDAWAVKNNVLLSYVENLIIIREALKERKYMRVCNEIITLFHRQQYFHKGVKYNLLHLLQIYLNV